MGRGRATLKDIALATGFSANTLSLALRGSERLPESTRSKIAKVAERLNYYPNNIARSLAGNRTQSIGLVMTDILNPTLTLAAHTIETELATAGYAVLFAASHSDVEDEKRVLSMFRSYQVDGILIYPADRTNFDHLRRIDENGTPVLSLVDIPHSGIDCVAIDDTKGAFYAVQHLCQLGHRRIAVIDGHRTKGNLDKMNGAKHAVDQAGLPPDTLIPYRPQSHAPHHAAELMEGIMSVTDAPTAVFASTDSLALGVLHWCRGNGISVPDQLAVVGYDNTEAAEFNVPALTTVNYGTDAVSRLGVSRILDRIRGADTWSGPETQLIAPHLVRRETT